MNWTLLANSLAVAGAAALLAVAWGALVALLISLAQVTRGCLLALTVAALALPAFLVTNCWIDLLGAAGRWRGWLPFDIFSPAGTVWILSLLLWPIPALAIAASWRKLERVHFEIDPALRGGLLLRLLLWPAARSSVWISAAVVFALALNNFSVPAILQVKVLPAEVWVQFNTNLDAAAALRAAWPLIILPLGLLWLLRGARFQWPREDTTDTAPALRRQLGARWVMAAIVGGSFVFAAALGGPLVQLTSTARTWNELLPAAQAGSAAIWNSFLYASIAALGATAGGLWLARFRSLGWLWVFFLVPGVIVGVGASTTFNQPGLEFFSRTAAIVIALLIVRHLALARALGRAALDSVDASIVDSGRLDGARGLTLFRHLILPQIAPRVGAAAYAVYVLSLWDVETTLLVIPPGGETLALRIFNLLHYGHNAHVNALCLILLLLALAPLLIWAAWRATAARLFLLVAVLMLGVAGCGRRTAITRNATPVGSVLFSQVEIIGQRGTGAGEFNKPRSLTCDRAGNLYVADMTGRIQKFSPDGKFLLSWQMPQTDLGKAKGMSCDRDGNIIVLEPHYQRVNHFTPEGRLVHQWGIRGTNAGELTLPRAIVVDTKGRVIVSEYTLVDRVQQFTPRGERVLAAWGTPGLAPGQFNRAEGVTTDARDQIYVADSCNHRIQIFAPDGRFLRAYGRAGTQSGDLSYPYDIAVDEQGRQYVCEFGNSRIQVFAPDGKVVEIIGRPGGDPGEFANPWSAALDAQGNLYVADSMNHRVQKFVRRAQP